MLGPDVEFDGASFDTRSIEPGQLFVPIVAERNGHEFIGQAYDAGAALHLTSQADEFRKDHTSIEVADTARALMDLAAFARTQSSSHVVGVTGSVGKTSTKDLIGAACSVQLRTTANERSFNNEQGLPVTILNAPDDTEALILEMGMRGFGQITALCEDGSARDRRGDDRGLLPHRTGRRHRRRCAGQAGARRGAPEVGNRRAQR